MNSNILNPANVDFLNIGNGCNLNCRQCYFREKGKGQPRNMKQDLRLADKLIKRFSQSSVFVYPMEISTSMELASLFKRVGQKSVLSNGITIDEEKIEKLIESGIEEIKITLFAYFPEHKFFNGIDRGRYFQIMENIRLCKKKGLRVVIDNILSKATTGSIISLAKKGSDLGVDKIEFIRLKPVGNAKKMDQKFLLDVSDMPKIIENVEICKQKFPETYYRFNYSFGPNFYGKSIAEAALKVKKGGSEWTKAKFLCPAIDGNYLGISFRSGKIYSCFFAMDQEDFAIGRMSDAGERLKVNQTPLSSKMLKKKLRGNCHKDNCEYQSICMGGCRSIAYIFAKLRGETDPLFAGMDICITKAKEAFGFKA